MVSIGALVASWVLVGTIRTLALRRGVLDIPNARSSHVRPTPRLGGVGIVAAVVVPVVAVAAGAGLLTREIVVVLALATTVSLVSLLDDLRGLPAVTRLLVHLATAALAVAYLGPLDVVVPGVTGGVARSAVAHGLTVVWIAGFINAFNFMDGTDGIAAGQAIVAATGWGIAGWWLNEPGLALLGAAVAAASAGFLPHNWSPATIFMGDVGSAFLGFLLATLPLLVDSPRPLLTAWLPVWPFVFDTTITLARRAHRGENLLAAHRSHLYQRLTQSGWPHGRAAILYSALALAGVIVAVPMSTGVLSTPLPALTLLAAGSALLWMLVRWQEARRPTQTVGVMPSGGADHA